MLRLLSPTWSNGPAIGIWKSSHVVRQRRGVFSRIRVNQPEYRIVINVTVYSYYTSVFFFFSKKKCWRRKGIYNNQFVMGEPKIGPHPGVVCRGAFAGRRVLVGCTRSPRCVSSSSTAHRVIHRCINLEPWKSCWLTARCWPMIRAVCWPASSMLWQRFGRCRFRGWCVPCVEYGEVMPRGNPRRTGHGGGDGH
jgi:hypothetical protein